MRNLGLVSIILVLLTPLSYADPVFVGYGTLYVTASGPYDGYALDYDGKISASIPGIVFPTNDADVFCVSSENLNNKYTDYDFFKFVTPVNEADYKIASATWVADNWVTKIKSDDTESDIDILKGEAQKAIWKVLGVLNLVGNDGVDYDLYTAALKQTGYITENWLWAVNPSTHNPNANRGYDSQNFLVPFSLGGSVHTPEPSTLILLGLGLAGVGAYRKLRS